MKLCRITTGSGLKPAAMDHGGKLRDLSTHIVDIDAAETAPDRIRALQKLDISKLPVIEGTPAPFLGNVGRVFCIGLNYYDHAEEMAMPVPDHPILFMKACPVSGANDPIMLPKGSTKTDWEVELGVVIGTTAQHVSEADALNYVAGYCVANDVSERSFQMEFGGQWVKGKSADTFAPIGPFLATPDEISDLADLDLSLDVNGERMQTGNTATMIFSVPQIIAHVSQFLTLRPGYVIMTGTPPGVGGGMKPPRFLKPGDVVEARIEGLGEIRQNVIAFDG